MRLDATTETSKDAFRSKIRFFDQKAFGDDTKVVWRTAIVRLKSLFRTFGTAQRKFEESTGEAQSFGNQLGSSNAAG